MVYVTSILAASLALSGAVSAIPLQKRIAQTISDSTTQWVAACTKAGGGSQCGTISQTAFTTLLAAGKNCDQQDAADQMVSLAKQLNNDPDMIRLAQIFVQQPRNAPDSLQVPYCQTAPKNAELNGFFHCQFSGSNFQKFSGDQTGNLPLGVSAVNPPGSCPARNSPVPDGVQLDTLVQSPGTPIGGGSGATAASTGSSNSTSTASSDATGTSSSAAVEGSGIATATATVAARAAVETIFIHENNNAQPQEVESSHHMNTGEARKKSGKKHAEATATVTVTVTKEAEATATANANANATANLNANAVVKESSTNNSSAAKENSTTTKSASASETTKATATANA